MIRGFFSCFKTTRSFEIDMRKLDSYQRAVFQSIIATEEDKKNLTENIETASNNTDVLEKTGIYFEGIQRDEKREKPIENPIVLEKKRNVKKTS